MIRYSTMVNWLRMKIKVNNISSVNQHLSVSGKDRGINAFQIIKNIHPLLLKSKKISSGILNLYYITGFYATRILEIIIWPKLLNGSSSRYAGIHINIEKVGPK